MSKRLSFSRYWRESMDSLSTYYELLTLILVSCSILRFFAAGLVDDEGLWLDLD